MSVRRIVPPAMQPLVDAGAYAPAVLADGLLLVSGQVGRDADLVVVDSSLEDHVRATFENLRTVVEHAGGTLADVVELTSYHVGMAEQMPTFTAVKREYFPDAATLPAWTAVGVAELNAPQFRVEIQAVARIVD